MKQVTKDIILLILIFVVGLEFLIYYSEFNLVNDKTIEIGLITLMTCIIFTSIYFKKGIYRFLIGLPILIIGGVFLFLEIMGAIAGSEKINCNWEIEEYEIIYATQEYFAGPGSEPYLKLQKKYIFDLLYKTFDKQKTEYKFMELCFEQQHCIIEFEKTETKFNLCDKVQLK